MNLSFWKDKRVFITGHTGFKGAWLCYILSSAGAKITGYSLPPPTSPNLFSTIDLESKMKSVLGDIRDREHLLAVFFAADPEIVIHMAAQPIVRESYKEPVYTYETNVMGTVNILECMRLHGGVRSFLNVTTDKVYLNREWCWPYREDDPLDGFDPYSNSKSCSELITHSYKNSFFYDSDTAVSTARAGNVIGGGDFANDRIIPDCVRAVLGNEPIIVRNQYSIRPYQHVLEPLVAYLEILENQYNHQEFSGFYNVGPDDHSCITTGALVELFCNAWGEGLEWKHVTFNGPHESNILKLDCSLIKSKLGWKPKWDIKIAVSKTVEWTRIYLQHGDICAIMNRQLVEYMKIGE